jgi:hypothetical protein
VHRGTLACEELPLLALLSVSSQVGLLSDLCRAAMLYPSVAVAAVHPLILSSCSGVAPSHAKHGVVHWLVRLPSQVQQPATSHADTTFSSGVLELLAVSRIRLLRARA